MWNHYSTSACLKLSNITTKILFFRSLHIFRKDGILPTKQTYCKRLWHAQYVTHNSFKGFSAVCQIEPFSRPGLRYYSDMKDDDMVKGWVKEIKDDFKSEKLGDKNNETGLDDTSIEIAELEHHGFTTEEIIQLLKDSEKPLDEVLVSEGSSSDSDSSSDSSSSDSDIESDSSDSDTEKATDEKLSETGEKSESAISSENDTKAQTIITSEDVRKMQQEDWAVVKMKDSVKSEWSEIEIEDFVNIAEVEPEVQEWIPPVSLLRGKTGVFEVEDVVTVLRNAKARDICTIRIPASLDFADYMVIASATSLRHMRAIKSDLRLIYRKRMNKNDRHFRVEGEDTDWRAVDLGNVILHVFMPETRELYDLETLWTVGSKFDPKCREQSSDIYTFSVDELPWLKELELEKQQKLEEQESKKRRKKLCETFYYTQYRQCH